MTMYVGDTLMVRTEAKDPYTNEHLDPMPLKAMVSFWAPGVNRRTELPSYGPFEMQRLVERKIFLHYQDTEDWAPGEWTYGILIEDVVKNREYSSFTLAL